MPTLSDVLKRDLTLTVYAEPFQRGVIWVATILRRGRMKYSAHGETPEDAVAEVVELAYKMEI